MEVLFVFKNKPMSEFYNLLTELCNALHLQNRDFYSAIIQLRNSNTYYDDGQNDGDVRC